MTKKPIPVFNGKVSAKPLPCNHVIGSSVKKAEEIILTCDQVRGACGEAVLKETFEEFCTPMRRRYGPRCHKVCRMMESDYTRIRASYSQAASKAVREMDYNMIKLWYSETPEDPWLVLKNMAQILEIHSPYNRHWTRVNLKYGPHHVLKDAELEANYFKYDSNSYFRKRFRVMKVEIVDGLNAHYAKEKFETSDPTPEDLIWTYRFGRAIEYFGIHHPKLFHFEQPDEI